MRRNALKNLAELNKAHREFMRLSKEDIGESLEKVGFKFFSFLQVLTPYDLGQAQGGWIVKLNSSAPSEWKPQQGLNSYALQPFPHGQIKFNSMVWISNNVVYIKRLDEGHSMQAPYGFTNDALRKTTFYIESEINKLNRKRYNV